MAGSNNFTGQNIQDTYQRVLQISSSGQLADGTGSLVPVLEANRFKGDARDLFNVPQDLVWDGTMADGYLQIITNNSYAALPSAHASSATPTSSLEFNYTAFNFTDPVSEPVIYCKAPGAAEDFTMSGLLGYSTNCPIIFSGSNFAINAVYQSMIDAGGIKVIDLNALDSSNNGSVNDTHLLKAISDKLTEHIDTSFNIVSLSYNLQDSYKRIANDTGFQQIAVSTLKTIDPAQTEVFSFHYFTSASTARGGTYGGGDMFQVTTNPNKVYTSLNTDLDTTFNSTVTVNGEITASGAISGSGDIYGNNLYFNKIDGGTF
jgi:hypothetical protein